jgi:hypothetical protein
MRQVVIVFMDGVVMFLLNVLLSIVDDVFLTIEISEPRNRIQPFHPKG